MRPKLFEQRCRQKIVSFLFEMLKYTQISDIFNDLRDDRVIGVRLNKLPENAVFFWRLCFLMILVTIVTTGVMIIRKKVKQNKQLCFYWLRFAILVIAFLCFVTVIVTTLFLSFNFWVKKGCTQLINDPNLCYGKLDVTQISFPIFFKTHQEEFVEYQRRNQAVKDIENSPLSLQRLAKATMTSLIRR